jgi:hypothetical protein
LDQFFHVFDRLFLGSGQISNARALPKLQLPGFGSQKYLAVGRIPFIDRINDMSCFTFSGRLKVKKESRTRNETETSQNCRFFEHPFLLDQMCSVILIGKYFFGSLPRMKEKSQWKKCPLW